MRLRRTRTSDSPNLRFRCCERNSRSFGLRKDSSKDDGQVDRPEPDSELKRRLNWIGRPFPALFLDSANGRTNAEKQTIWSANFERFPERFRVVEIHRRRMQDSVLGELVGSYNAYKRSFRNLFRRFIFVDSLGFGWFGCRLRMWPIRSKRIKAMTNELSQKRTVNRAFRTDE